jgi:amidase
MTTLPDLAWLDALALADLVRKKEVSPLELVEATIARIEALNPTLNAVITPMYEEARATAKQPLGDGAFAGVPFLLKDLVAEYAGVPMAEGSNFLKGRYTPDQDSELVVRQKAAGLIIVAKTNTPEFGLLPTTEPLAFGATHNPWDTTRTPAGSSGGAAAAVAAGIAPMAHANDGGGSIRMPASCCGLFGLKPTRARNSLGPAMGEAGCGLAAEHAVTRSIRDSAALLDATSEPMTGDPYYPTPPGRPYLEEVGADPGRLRIALNTTPLTGAEVHPDCRAAAEETARLCADLGHEIVEATPDVDGMQMVKRFGDAWTGFFGGLIADLERRLDRTAREGDFEPATWATFLHAKKQTTAEYLMAVQDLHALSRDVARFFADFDAMITPTQTLPPVPLGYFEYTPDDPRDYVVRLCQYTGFTLMCNVTGQPAMSLPLNWNDQGLPIGVQVVGRYGDEAMLFRIAGQLEAAKPWTNRRPPVCVQE